MESINAKENNISAKSWVVVFFIKDIQTYEAEVDKMLRNIKNVKLGARVKVLVLREKVTVVDLPVAKIKALKYKVELSEYIFDYRSQRMEEIPIQIREIDYENKQSWSYLLTYIYTTYKADYSIMYTMSHGAAFGIYNTDLEIKSNDYFIIRTPPSKFFEKENLLKFKGVYEGSNAEVIFNKKEIVNTELQTLCKNIEILWISDFSNLLRTIPGFQKINIILMNNCYMQLFDTGYILRGVAEYLAAPESQMSPVAYDLKQLLTRISMPETVSLDVVLDSIIVDFKQTKDPYIPATALFVNKLLEYNTLLSEFDKILVILEQNLQQVRPILNDIIQNKIQNFDASSTLFLIDLNKLLFLLKDRIGNPQFDVYYDNFQKMLNTEIVIVPHRKHVGDFYAQNDQMPNRKAYGPSGFTISFPPTKEIFEKESILLRCSYWGLEVRSPFAKDSYWDNFLIKYYI